MPQHRLAEGRELIGNLLRLGKALGYAAQPEFPIERHAHGPAVDVAWLADENQTHPLFIFEVESSSTNSAANNAVKVFGPPIELFEKPLFFFHVFVKGFADSDRIENLRRTYQTHNYRSYRIYAGDLELLVRDALAQHRKLQSNLSAYHLAKVLESMNFTTSQIADILSFAENIRFQSDYLVAQAKLACESNEYRHLFAVRLQKLHNNHPDDIVNVGYPSYMGERWYFPVHIGILHKILVTETQPWREKLINWQANGSSLPQIGPHLCQWPEYEHFMFGPAPLLWAVVAALMRSDNVVTEFILRQCQIVMDAIEPSQYSFYWALWILHMSASLESLNCYEHARSHINSQGGINSHVLYSPPSSIDIETESCEWFEKFDESRQPVPEMESFKENNKVPMEDCDQSYDPFRIATRLLLEENFIFGWSQPVANMLSARL